MGIIRQKNKDGSGRAVEEYVVVAEAINIYSGLRIQKKKRGVSSLPKAERIYRELWHQCRNEKPAGLSIKTWSELTSKYLESVYKNIRSASNPSGFSPQVAKTKASHLKHTLPLGSSYLPVMTQQFWMEWLDLCESQGFTRSMTVHIQKEVKAAFTFAFQVGAVPTNQLAGMKLRKLNQKGKDAFTHEEANKLLQEAKNREHKFYYIWLLSLTLGVRRSELAGLKWTDLDLNLRLASLSRQNIPKEGIVENLKGKRARKVAIPDYVIPELKALKLKNPGEFVIDPKTIRWRGGEQAKVLREFCKEIGIREMSHHSLRATHITLGLLDGVSVGAMKENVGHSRLSTTDVYFRSSGINLIGQTDALNIKVPQAEQAEIIQLSKVTK